VPLDLLAGLNLALPRENQNLQVTAGSTKASNTSATGLRISISAVATGAVLSLSSAIVGLL
jgi:hypothetical protein